MAGGVVEGSVDDVENRKQAAAKAIRVLRSQVRWKPGKDAGHLAKRKVMGHLPAEATADDYNTLIGAVLNEVNSLIYHYPFSATDYYAVSGSMADVVWLVIFGADGVMETAFPPDDLADYLTKRGFVLLGQMGEIVHE